MWSITTHQILLIIYHFGFMLRNGGILPKSHLTLLFILIFSVSEELKCLNKKTNKQTKTKTNKQKKKHKQFCPKV